MESPYLEIPRLLERGERVVLARIVRQKGSSPRALGTACLIREDGSPLGTIGGGSLEYRVCQRAKEVLQEGRSALIHFQLSGQDAASTQMLCGGVVDVYLEPLFPEDAAVQSFFRRVADLVRGGDRGVLVTRVADGIEAGSGSFRLLLTEGGELLGAIEGLSQERIPHLRGEWIRAEPRMLEVEGRDLLLFVEPLRPAELLLLFGGGHISTCLVPLAKGVGFRVTVVDDRKEFSSPQRFPDADETLTLPFEEVFGRLSVTPDTYIAIITRGHIYDLEVLRWALSQRPAYIGMIGSRRKRDMIYERLRDEGISEERLREVHAPIGLDIGAETPEEIAVSIVAELIQERASRRGTRDAKVDGGRG